MTSVRLQWFGEQQVARTLESYADRHSDATPAWHAIADSFKEASARQFDSSGAYGGDTWAPLSPAYAAWKATRYPGRPILVRDGDLRRSLAESFDIEVIEPTFMIVGSDSDYGVHHQRGGGNLPQRKPVNLPESWRRNAVRTLARFLSTGDPRGA